DLRAASSVVCHVEDSKLGIIHDQRFEYAAARYRQYVTRSIVVRGCATRERKATQIDHVACAQGVNRVAELTAGKGRVLDAQRLAACTENDVAMAGGTRDRKIERSSLEKRVAVVRVGARKDGRTGAELRDRSGAEDGGREVVNVRMIEDEH